MRSKGFGFTLGVWGLRVCSPDIAQLFASVRFPTLRSRHGTLWHSNMFHTVSKGVLCDRRIPLARLSEDELHFCGH